MRYKISLANGITFIYLHVEKFIYIYDWNLNLHEKIELDLNYVSTVIMEMGNKLITTDGYGNIHEFYP